MAPAEDEEGQDCAFVFLVFKYTRTQRDLCGASAAIITPLIYAWIFISRILDFRFRASPEDKSSLPQPAKRGQRDRIHRMRVAGQRTSSRSV